MKKIRFRPDDLLTFARVAHHKSFSRAATELGLSRSATSERVRRLEDQVGAVLFHRTTRSVRLTAAGERLAESAHKMVEAVERANDSVARTQAGLEGPILVTTTAVLAGALVGPAAADLMTRYPLVCPLIRTDDKSVVLSAGGFDLAIRAGPSVIQDEVVRVLAPLRTIAVATPRYLEDRGEPPDTPWRTHNLICTRPGPQRLDGDDVSPAAVSNHSPTVLRWALSGLGIALVPEIACWDEIQAGTLAAIGVVEERPLTLVLPSRRWIPPAVQGLIEAVEAKIAAWPNPPALRML